MGEEWDRHECVLSNEWGLGLLSVRNDSKADSFVWRSMVALLGLWGHAGMERCETLGIKHIKACSNSKMYVNWRNWDSLCKPKQSVCCEGR